jgi:hypothetical protein
MGLDFPPAGSGPSFMAGEGYAGSGASRGLSRGLLAFHLGRNLTEEGMGIGAIAIRQRGWFFFSATSRTEFPSEGEIVKTFAVDRRLVWAVGGRPSLALTRLFDRGSELYMGSPQLQRRLWPAMSRLRDRAGLTQHFQAVAPVAEGKCQYAVRGGQAQVHCKVTSSRQPLGKVFVMNELGAGVFSRATCDGRLAPPPSSWQPLPEPMAACSLYSPGEGLTFLVRDLAVEQERAPGRPVRVRAFWGREETDDLRWAGFEFELDCGGDTMSVACRYTVELFAGQ